MNTKIQRWGNSQAIRIPKSILTIANMHENDEVDIKVQSGNIIITPAKKHKTLKDRLKGYEGDFECTELKTGDSVGKEVF